MAINSPSVLKTHGYRAGAFAFVASIAVILAALAFQYIGGYQPCPLCEMQRYAYYAAIPLLFVALVMMAAEHRTIAALIFALVAIAFFANAGLAVYHAGAEWKFWPGPSTCAAASGELSTNAGDLLKQLEQTRVIRCDEAAWRFLGLSFAGWNVVTSLMLGMTLAIAAARTSRD